MQGLQPFRSQAVVSLTSLDIDAKFLKFGVCSFESDKYISIRDEAAGNGQLTIYDLETKSLSRKPNKSEKVLMHPRQNIIALMAKAATGTGNVVQIFNMAERQKLKDLTFNENIVYWHWVTLQKLAIVTTTSVYHVNIANANEAQVKILDRSGQLAEQQVQIIGYCLEATEKWCALFGISTPDGGNTINGHIQLYLIEGAKQQLLDGHCCAFGEAFVHSDTQASSLFCFFEKKADQPPKVQISEIGVPPAGATKHKKTADFALDPMFPKDFPVVMQVSQKFGVLYLVTKMGFFYAYEITTAQLVYKSRISDQPVFVGARDEQNDGIYVIAKNGNVILTRAEPAAIVPYMLQNCQYIPDLTQLCFKLASRYNLPGVDSMFTEQFNRAIIGGDYKQAATIASSAPGTLLRNAQTIQRFKGLQAQPGQPQPILVYFQTLLEKGRLNKAETLELCAPVLQQQSRIQLVQGWVRDGKLELCEELGDLVRPLDPRLAVDIYKQSNTQQKAVQVLLEIGATEDALIFTRSTPGASIDYVQIVRNALQSGNAESALNVAKNYAKTTPGANVHGIAELFAQANRFQELTAFLVESMKSNRPEDGPWQTRVLEFNLHAAPQVAETILQMEMWNQFNRPKIAQLCEQKGLFQRALENYNELKDLKRCVLNTHAIKPEWLTTFVSKMQPEWNLACSQELIRHNRQNTQIVVNVFLQSYQSIGVEAAVKVFESVGCYDGIYLFLGAIINNIEDKNIIFKYIEASCKCGQLRVVESIIKDRPESYDAQRVKSFLMELKLPDPKPLIFLCDIHNFVEELTKYLYKNNFNKYIEIYLFKVNPNMTPQVLGALIDLECDENYIKQILYNIRGGCPIEPLIEEFEKRNKIRVLENWLDSRVAEGNQIPAVHNALAKIKIDTNQDPENFLMNNQFYDPKVIGKFCEDRDPHFAVIAYKRSWGTCDQELITVTNKNALFRLQARYLVERQSKELWQTVLSPDNPYRKQIIEQVVSAALPESKNVDEVSTTVQAFMEANLPLELISLLEKIVLHNSEFGKYKKLQNLLIITAIKSDKTRVIDYINRLDNYDGPEIAKIALGEQYQLYEEAFVIYKRINYNVEAINVLLDNIEDQARAAEFAEKVNQSDVWSRLGQAYLSQYQVTDAINAFLRAKDYTQYGSIVLAAENDGKTEDLTRFLQSAREVIKDSTIDNALAYCYAKLDKLAELEAFVTGANSIDAQKVGDRCFDQKLYQAAKILYISIKNNSKIASCLVRLKEFSQAIESAKKANTPKTWKELCMACVEAQEFKLAAVAGMNIIIHPDHLEDLIRHYEEFGVAKEMIELLETGMGLERAHIGIYTELGVLYAKYQPQSLMEHIKQYFSKINVSKLLRTCKNFQLWREAVYLHQNYEEYDSAINIMIEHSPTAFQHEPFVSIIQRCTNADLYYRAILFYLEEQPDKLNDLLKSLTTKLDVSKVVSVMRKTGFLGLIIPFMKSVQNVNNKELNEALNELYLEQEDYDALKQSITQYQAFDQAQLARQCENHPLSQFRRIAAYLYRKAKQYEFSIKISKQDQEFRDAIETAHESQKPELVEELLRFFVAQGEKEFFTVCLYTAYDIIKPDIVMELSWRFGLMEYAMPFFIQITRELTSRVENVQKKHEERTKKEEKQAQEQQNKPLDSFVVHPDGMLGGFGMPGFGTPMLPPGPMLGSVPPPIYPGGGSPIGGVGGAPYYSQAPAPFGAPPAYGNAVNPLYRSGV